MKKVFTSISMALCLVASSFTTSAQTVQLSEAQKTEIQKEVLPVVFEQIKEQTGLDILGWAQPQLSSNFIGSLPVLNNLQSGLRADTPTPYSVKPDSILISTAAISPNMVKLLGETMKITFGNHLETEIPLVGDLFLGRPLKIDMPGLITVTTTASNPAFQHLVDITIVPKQTEGRLVDVDITAVLFGDAKNNTKELMGLSVIMNVANASLDCNLDIREGFRNIWGLVGLVGVTLPALPEMDFRVSVGIAVMATMTFPAYLYGIPEATPTQMVPMGDAELSLDFSKKIPVNYIGLTSYENAAAKGWRKLWFNVEQKNTQDLVLTIDNYVYATVAKADSTLEDKTIVTMSDYTQNVVVTNSQSAMKSVIGRVVSELAAEGKATWYKMQVQSERDMDGDGVITNDEKASIMDIEVTPYISGTNAIAEINIKSYEYGDKEELTTTEMNVNATADLTSRVIKVDVVPTGSPVAMGSAYFTSNIAGIVTSNDDITINTVKVTPVEGGIYIDNSGKATYRIVNMSGATIANGTVSGDNAYISTSSLAKGIYVIVVTENGVSQSVKFAR